jgi:hypothetical protein
MIIIQIVLVSAFLFLLFIFLANAGTSLAKAWEKLIAMALVAAAIVAVLFPDTLNDIADWVGVGRGADLLLYGLATAFIFTTFSSHLQRQQERQRMAKLIRRIAILEAEERQSRQS